MNAISNNGKRCVHLDFHTSPLIKGIGSRFSKERFQAALKAGKIDSITVFAKCHHGMCYYPTEVGTMHPGLDFDLLGKMIDAAHEIGVKAPVYITAGWCAHDAEAHPEWIARDKDGSKKAIRIDENASPDTVRPDCSWYNMCLNDGEYCEHIYALTKEICERYKDLDGLFFDICVVGGNCYCESCVAKMKAEGIDIDDDAAVYGFYIRKHRDFMRKCSELLHSYHPNATIFFNSGGADPKNTFFHEYQTHFEMEDLPTCWGGYDKLPPRAKFFAKTGKNYTGMTGKFHLSWGEFGGYKPKEALRHEITLMAMYGAGCSVGDHLHPDGEPEMATYEAIGYAYDYYNKIIPYCKGKSLATLGVYYTNDATVKEGIFGILEELHIDYEFVNAENIDKFDTVIIPEKSVLSDAELEAVKAYAANGGKLIFFGQSLVKDGKFVVPCGAEYVEKASGDCDYILVTDSSKYDIPKAPVLCYAPAEKVKLTDGEVLAEVLTPYFTRTYGHYCGHKNTPYDKDAARTPAIVKKGNVIYCAHGIAGMYRTHGSLVHQRIFAYILDFLYTERPIRVDLGIKGRTAYVKQEGRYCFNMAYASPTVSGCAEIIADIPTLYGIGVKLLADEKIKRIYLPLENKELEFVQNGNECCFTVPKLEGHTSVVLEY